MCNKAQRGKVPEVWSIFRLLGGNEPTLLLPRKKSQAGFELESTTEKKRPYELRARTFARKIQDMATAFPKMTLQAF